MISQKIIEEKRAYLPGCAAIIIVTASKLIDTSPCDRHIPPYCSKSLRDQFKDL